MPVLKWSEAGKKFYETGTEKGVLYVMDESGAYPTGVPWNGLIGVTESPSGAEPTPIYADNGKYLTLMSAESFGATIEAYTSPEEFDACDGSATLGKGVSIGQQGRKQFGLSYVTTVGNDIEGEAHGYKIHLIYGCLASPSEKAYKTINDSPEAITFSWEVSTTPVPVEGFKPTASLVIDSRTVDAAKLRQITDLLWGSTSATAKLPTPDEIKTILSANSVVLKETN